jgi:hypothetical protein
MSKTVKLILAANLLVITVLVFVFPHLMISPGKLIPGHKQLETDCFACHLAWRGSAAERCVVCHAPKDIGRVTTTGQPIVRTKTVVAFHQDLTEDNCTACHTDHAGTKRYQWQGRFDHALLKAGANERCATCHQSPKDNLHRQIDGNCGQCHSQTKWTPATFDHDKYFVLDRDHNDRCVTCHVGNDYKRYTCYGCHEHSLGKIRREHIEEGISNFDDCVQCHRSANEHDIRGRGGRGGEHEGRHGREHDDD